MPPKLSYKKTGTFFERKSTDCSPGPGAYNVDTYKPLDRTPIVLKSRHQYFNDMEQHTPAPNKYDVNRSMSCIERHMPSISFGSRSGKNFIQQHLKNQIKPSPAEFDIRQPLGGRSLSMRYRCNKKEKPDSSPAPNAYHAAEAKETTYAHMPQLSMSFVVHKKIDPQKETRQIPAANAYNTSRSCLTTSGAGRFSCFYTRGKYEKRFVDSPAPNAYDLSKFEKATKPSSQSSSFRFRSSGGETF